MPSWPKVLDPQQSTDPVVSSAHVEFPPAEMADTPESRPVPPTPTTWTGVLELVVELLPSWPLELVPQQSTVPFERRAQEELPPALAATCVVVTGPGVTEFDADEALLVPTEFVAVTVNE